jgi:hypothetical protein
MTTSEQLPAEIIPGNRLLTAAEFHRLADVPPEGCAEFKQTVQKIECR